MAEGLSLYQVLGCEPGALFEELRACFRRRALSVHPDKGGSKEAFQQVLAAFETLADPAARATYDQRHAAAVRPATYTRAEQDAEAEGGRGRKRKRRRTGEERQQSRSSSAFGGAATPREEQQPKQRRQQQHQQQQQQQQQQLQQQQQQPQPRAQAKQSTGASSQDRPCQEQDDSTPASQTQELEVKKTISVAEQVPADQQQQPQQQPQQQQQQQQPEQQKSQGAAQVSEEFLLEKLRQLLQRLPPAVRKAVIEEIPQNMRRALELWMLDRRTQATRTDAEVSQKLCQRSGDCSEDTSDDSSQDSSECNEADADCGLALCDTTAACRDASCKEVISMSDDSSDMSEQEPDTHVAVSFGADVPDKTLSIMQGFEEEFPPEVAAEGGPGSGSHVSRRNRHGRTCVQGIACVRDTCYRACQLIGILSLESRVVPDLATALDHLAVITVLKQRAQHGVFDGGNFDDCMRRALAETESEVGVEAMEDLNLKFYLTVSKSYWVSNSLHTLRTACLETALAHRGKFAELQQELSHRGIVSPGLLNRFSIADLEDNWRRFSALYIEACCGPAETANLDASSPKSRDAVAKRLAALVEANSAHREKQLRAWNCRQMLYEERLQRQAERTERHALLRDARTERLEAKSAHQEEQRRAWNCRQMLQEERLQRQLARTERRALQRDARTERRALLRDRRAMSREDRDETRRRKLPRRQKLPSELVQRLVRRWERLQSQRRRQEAAVLQQELAKQRAAALSNCKELAKQRAAAKVELRRCRAEREERWRWMNRRDLTMADILGQQAL
ncbi:unnamed protein product [Polarella glacialis]|uniref:J domain-containing protein n=1 Tax=Polarella glacialis TaxID=89957 RepID=A0A813GLS3_POLGL|nr:unnamed protein product [Polarella glacialis]